MAKRTFRKRMPRRGETGLLMMIRTVGLVTIASMFLAVTTAWSAYDLSAQRIGASIDSAISKLNLS
ncbi:hypothetical protein [Terricaulis silvestris]|uniref:Uncharacterized protein n=1 Tax=Terricaulis silvestris TaxID=2686094 RepID=A0A6I6MWT6_9CAUL|nr:hypothetical protein [Terricaulis silvestris]QGZ95663.1 hypothetical protein DSM104635_02513 [Terricaulis silvestris]